jgi:hypothetical protein
MAAAVAALPAQVVRSTPIPAFTCTGFALTHAISLAITGADASFILHDSATTDGAGAYTWAAGEITLEQLGPVAWSINDGTTTISGSIQVVSD